MTSGVLKLAGRGADWYAKWLLHGLRTVELGQDPGYVPAFAGAESLIYPDTNGIVGDLAVIRDRLDVSARNDFDDGVTEAVNRLDLVRHEDVVLAKQLARLASLVGNRQAVHKLALCLDPARSDEDARDLNVEIVSAIVAHPYADDERSREALYRLARSASFKGNRAPQVLLALCKAAPADLVGHLVLLNQFLAPMYAPEKLLENETRCLTVCKLVKDIYALVDAAVFVAAVEGWGTRCTPASGYSQYAYTQDWLTTVILRSSELQQLAAQAEEISAKRSQQSKEGNIKHSASAGSRSKVPGRLLSQRGHKPFGVARVSGKASKLLGRQAMKGNASVVGSSLTREKSGQSTDRPRSGRNIGRGHGRGNAPSGGVMSSILAANDSPTHNTAIDVMFGGVDHENRH